MHLNTFTFKFITITKKKPPLLVCPVKRVHIKLACAVKRVVKEKPVVVVVIGTLVVGVTAFGIWAFHNRKKRKQLEEQCNAWVSSVFTDYINKASEGSLDIKTIEACEDAFCAIPQITDKILISLTKEQILGFTASIREYTEKLAEIYKYQIEEDELSSDETKMITSMLDKLKVQKKILRTAA